VSDTFESSLSFSSLNDGRDVENDIEELRSELPRCIVNDDAKDDDDEVAVELCDADDADIAGRDDHLVRGAEFVSSVTEAGLELVSGDDALPPDNLPANNL
jgi:hypothetical protein